MEKHEYLEIKNKFVALNDKCEALASKIRGTLDPSQQALLRADYRDAFEEKQELMSRLIESSETKPCPETK